jgi:hypothetical protein
MDETSRAWMWLRRLAGLFWSGSMMLAGLVLLSKLPALEDYGEKARQLALGLSVLMVSGGQFVFMALVADDIFPNVPAAMAGFLKATAGIVFWATLLWVGWQLMSLFT